MAPYIGGSNHRREGSGKEEKPDADFQGAGGNWPEGLRRNERKTKSEKELFVRALLDLLLAPRLITTD